MREVGPQGKLVFTAVISEKNFYKIIGRDNLTLAFLAVTLIGICIFLTFLCSRSNYQPIKHLIEEISGKQALFPKTNEIDIIRSYIRENRERVDSLSQYLADQQPILESQIVLMMISGKLKSQDDLEYYTRRMELDIKDSYWVSFVITLHEPDPSHITIEDILNEGRDFIPPRGTLLCAELIQDPGICYVFNFNRGEESHESVSCAAARGLYNHLINKGIKRILMGIGCSYDHFKMVKQSFYEAIAVTRIMYTDVPVDTAECIRLYSNTSEEKTSEYLLPPMIKYLLVEGLRHGDRYAALAALDDIVLYIKSSGNSSYLHIRLLSSDLLHLLIELASQENFLLSQSQILPILSFSTIAEFYEAFAILIKYLCDSFTKNTEIENKKLRDSVIFYTNANYTSPNFSLELVSDAFNLTQSKVSGIIKETFGCGFAQYVARLRMNEVKRRLVESGDSIQDIVHGVGYLDLPNFLRKFKQNEGLTPGQYRAVNKPPPIKNANLHGNPGTKNPWDAI
jgi:AraC-like DNA-binding protein